MKLTTCWSPSSLCFRYSPSFRKLPLSLYSYLNFRRLLPYAGPCFPKLLLYGRGDGDGGDAAPQFLPLPSSPQFVPARCLLVWTLPRLLRHGRTALPQG